MKQLDVDVSPPVFLWDPYLTLSNMTFDRIRGKVQSPKTDCVKYGTHLATYNTFPAMTDYVV